MISGVFTFGLLFTHIFFLFSCCLYFKSLIWKRNMWCNNPGLVWFVWMMDGKTNLYTHSTPFAENMFLGSGATMFTNDKKAPKALSDFDLCCRVVCVSSEECLCYVMLTLILQTRTVVVGVWDLQVKLLSLNVCWVFISNQYVNPANLLRCAFLVL